MRFKILPVIVLLCFQWLGVTQAQEKAEILPQLDYTSRVRAVAFSSDGRTVASVNVYLDQGTLHLWDVASGRQFHHLDGHGAGLDAVAFSPDGRIIASGNGRTLAVGSDDYTLQLLDVATGRELRTLGRNARRVFAIAFSPDGRTLASGSDRNTLKLWDVATGRELRTLSGQSDEVTSFEFSSADWGDVTSVAFSSDGRTLVSGGNTLNLWDVASGRKLRALGGHASPVSAVAFSPDGRTVASGSRDHTLKLWDVATGRAIRTLSGHADWVETVAFSPDGRIVASGDLGGTIKLWDATSGRELRTISGHTYAAQSIAFSPDGRTIVSGSREGTIKMWSSSTGKELASLIGFNDGEWAAITPEGYYSASENADKYLKIRVSNQTYDIDQYRERFYRPDLVKLALAGQALTGMASIGSVKPAPSVSIVDTPSSVSGDEATVKVKVADQGGGIGDVRLYLNGSAVVLENTRNLAVAAKPEGFSRVFAYKVRLVAGSNSLRAIAFNAGNSMQSTDAIHEIEARIAARKPALHALVVGINKYDNPKLELKYAVADAEMFAATLAAGARGLFESVSVKKLLTPAETSRTAIMQALQTIQKQARPEDLFVFYVASHGTVDEGEYFLVTSNVGATSTDKLKANALSQDNLKTLLANVPATKKLIVLDTCNAGKLADTLQVAMLTRGMSEDTAFKVLSRAVGSTILSASTSLQEALEGYQGHGLFTYVLTEGLKGKADLDNDGFIKTKELGSYLEDEVPLLAEKVFKHKQYPIVNDTGQGFPVVRVK